MYSARSEDSSYEATVNSTDNRSPTRRNSHSMLLKFDLSYLMKLIWITFSAFILMQLLSVDVVDTKRHVSKPSRKSRSYKNQLDILQGVCFDSFHHPEWWSYIWCYNSAVKQVHVNINTGVIEAENDLGTFVPSSSTSHFHIYESNSKSCASGSGSDILMKRRTKVLVKCCDSTVIQSYQHFSSEMYNSKHRTFIDVVYEPSPCSYVMEVCSELLCVPPAGDANMGAKDLATDDDEESDEITDSDPDSKSTSVSQKSKAIVPASQASSNSNHKNTKIKRKTGAVNGHRGPLFGYSTQSFSQQQLQANSISPEAQLEIRERVRKMFFHGYKSYIDHAFPMVSRHTYTCLCIFAYLHFPRKFSPLFHI